MPLYVRDEEVNELVERAQKVIGAATKTETVRVAVQKLLNEEKAKLPLRERLLAVRAHAARLGQPDPEFDDKKFFDEMWGHE